MFVTKLKWAAATLLAAAVLGSGAGVATMSALAGGQPPAATEAAEPRTQPMPPAASATAKAEAPTSPSRTVVALCATLQREFDNDKKLDDAPLRDVLEFLSDKYKVTFVVDTQAFEQANVGGGKSVEDSQVRLPKMPGVALETVLRYLTAQIDGTYLVRRNYIEITTRHRQVLEAFGPAVSYESAPPTVNVAFEARPLDKALADLAAQSGKNLVLDPRVQDRETLTVTAQLLNTPIDSAVKVVADMAGLQPVVLENVYYITTKENAIRLTRQEWERQQGEEPAKPAAPKPADK
jgi:type II secretory pathway component GspD/PulD (secretin)